MERVWGSPVTLLAGIGLFAIGGMHFYRLAVAPRVAKLTGR